MVEVVDEVVDDVVDEVVDEVVDDSDVEVDEDELLLSELLEVVVVPELEVGVFSVPKIEIRNDEPLNVSTLPFFPDNTQKDGEMQDTEFSLPTWVFSFPLLSVSPSLSGSEAFAGTIWC